MTHPRTDDDHPRLDSIASRRRVLAALAGVTAGGVGYATLGASPASAAVTVDSFDVTDDTYDAADGTLYSPWLDVTAAYSYEGVSDAAGVLVALLVDGGLLTTVERESAAGSDSGTLTVRGPVVDVRQWETDDWNVPDGSEQISHTLDVELLLEVHDADGVTLASDEVMDSVTITVTDAGPSQTVTVGGEGVVLFQSAESDPTPTPSE